MCNCFLHVSFFVCLSFSKSHLYGVNLFLCISVVMVQQPYLLLLLLCLFVFFFILGISFSSCYTRHKSFTISSMSIWLILSIMFPKYLNLYYSMSAHVNAVSCPITSYNHAARFIEAYFRIDFFRIRRVFFESTKNYHNSSNSVSLR